MRKDMQNYILKKKKNKVHPGFEPRLRESESHVLCQRVVRREVIEWDQPNLLVGQTAVNGAAIRLLRCGKGLTTNYTNEPRAMGIIEGVKKAGYIKCVFHCNI